MDDLKQRIRDLESALVQIHQASEFKQDDSVKLLRARLNGIAGIVTWYLPETSEGYQFTVPPLEQS